MGTSNNCKMYRTTLSKPWLHTLVATCTSNIPYLDFGVSSLQMLDLAAQSFSFRYHVAKPTQSEHLNYYSPALSASNVCFPLAIRHTTHYIFPPWMVQSQSWEIVGDGWQRYCHQWTSSICTWSYQAGRHNLHSLHNSPLEILQMKTCLSHSRLRLEPAYCTVNHL